MDYRQLTYCLIEDRIAAYKAVMAGYVKTFAELYPDKKPDEIKLTVKVVE